MGSQLIEYAYSGDDAPWRAAIDAFLQAIAADPVLRDGLAYHVYVRDDGIGRVHTPCWASDQVLDHLRAQPFFKTFAESVKGFAGDSLTVTKPTLSTG